jgi:hypothetical protein
MLDEPASDIGGNAGIEAVISTSYEIQVPVIHWDYL